MSGSIGAVLDMKTFQRVGSMSLGGLFIETPASKSLGSVVKLEFLVQEGQIRADGIESGGAAAADWH